MSKKGSTRHQQSQGLTYVAQKPSFLANFGRAPPSPEPGPSRGGNRNPRGRGGEARDGREPLPERPDTGEWAKGSDDEAEAEEGSDDEWGDVYSGSEDGPQVVVLKEGRHLTADEVKRERRRAAGKASESPPPKDTAKPSDNPSQKSTAKPVIPKPTNSSNKRKLVGEAAEAAEVKDNVDAKDGKAKKKKKASKILLSFNEEEGES